MSSILKALEKVEESQSRRSGGAGGFVRRRDRRPLWLLPAGVLGGAAVAALATFAAMGGFSRHAAPAAAAPEQAAVAQVTIGQPPALPVPASASARAVEAKPAPIAPAQGKDHGTPALAPSKGAPAPAHGVQVKPGSSAAQAVAKASPPAPAGKAKQEHKQEHKHTAQAESASREKHGRPRLPEVRPAASHPLAEKTPPVLAAPVKAAPAPVTVAKAAEKPAAQVRVTGIAWQKDGASSVAMVNGRPVQQGSVVDGYKVEQIYEDKVRFSGSKGSVLVPLGAGE